jgi:hypothetical protein
LFSSHKKILQAPCFPFVSCSKLTHALAHAVTSTPPSVLALPTLTLLSMTMAAEAHFNDDVIGFICHRQRVCWITSGSSINFFSLFV